MRATAVATVLAAGSLLFPGAEADAASRPVNDKRVDARSVYRRLSFGVLYSHAGGGRLCATRVSAAGVCRQGGGFMARRVGEARI